MTFEAFYELYKKNLQDRLKKSTWKMKTSVIESKILPYFKKKMCDIKPRDIVAWQNVMLKKSHPEVRLMLVVPYHPAIRPIEKPDGYDATYYPWEDEHIPKRLAIIKTNQRMVDTCDYLIANAWHYIGGSGQNVEYARKREKRGLIHIENLAEKLRESAI